MGLYLPRTRLSVASYVSDEGNGLLDGLLAYWAGNEASGDLLDLHSDGRTVTAQTAIGAATGKVYATARELNNAESDWFTRDDATLESLEAFTLALWEYPYAYSGVPGQYRSLVGNCQSSMWGKGFMTFHSWNGELLLTISNGGGAEQFLQWHCGVDPTENQWHSLIFWHDPNADVGGVQHNDNDPVTEAHDGGIGGASTRDFCIGRYSSSHDQHYFDGLLGPIAIWNRVLSAAERASWYNGGAGLAYSEFTA